MARQESNQMRLWHYGWAITANDILFQACGDILTKKKLDPHRSQCRGASFTCIDCMVHFHGTEYRSHTV